MQSGKRSTEHARAWRAEALGGILCAAGLWLVCKSEWLGALILVAGALLVGWVATSYMHARAAPKAAAERPRVLHAPPEV